jgi:6-phosphofructokinase 1
LLETKKNMAKINKIGVFTSGGDAPGMNAAVRAVVRTGLYAGLEVYGIYRGYQGMIENDIKKLKSSSVTNIIQRGGTILRCARSKEFMTPEGRKKAYENLRKHGIDALVAIGGDGTFTGARVFETEFDIPIIGIPGTIDNDLYGTDYTIGYDTAVNTVVEAVDKIRDTADSHGRLFIIEVMGRDAGFIALRSGVATGATDILVPETITYINELFDKISSGIKKRKISAIVIVAEGDDFGGGMDVMEKIKTKFPKLDIRVSILGHIQRGGSPSGFDRVLASGLGYEAVNALLKGERGIMVGTKHRKFAYTPLENAIKHHQEINEDMLRMARILSS